MKSNNYLKIINITLIIAIFFIIGFASTFAEALMPSIKKIFAISYSKTMLLDTMFFICFGMFSWVIAHFVKKTGIHKTINTGLFCIIAGSGIWTYSLYTQTTSFSLLLIAQFISSIGAVCLFICIEYLALLLNNQAKASRLAALQSSHAIGAFTAPVIIGFMLLRHSYAIQQIWPIFSAMLLLALALVALNRRANFTTTPCIQITTKAHPLSTRNKLNLALVFLALFLYVGVEITIGSFIMFASVHIYHVAVASSSIYLAIYWLLIIAGRLLGGILIRNKNIGIMLLVLSMLATVFLCYAYYQFIGGLYALVALGLFNSIMFPLIYSIGFASYPHADIFFSAYMSSAIIGGAVLPLATGFIADHYGIARASILCIASYLLISLLGYIHHQYNRGLLYD